MLFIIQHQTTELWLREAPSVMSWAPPATGLRADERPQSRPSRCWRGWGNGIMTQLIQAWDVLATLTPSEYTAFRPCWRRAFSCISSG